MPALAVRSVPCLQVWGLWWAVTVYTHYIRALAAKLPFRARGWQAVPWGPPRLRALPLEPLVKLTLPLIGALGELWLGHESWRSLYQADGKFFVNNLNDWQHATMYLSFFLSGIVDLLAHYLGAPPSAELVSGEGGRGQQGSKAMGGGATRGGSWPCW
jgi:hypothetical protein